MSYVSINSTKLALNALASIHTAYSSYSTIYYIIFVEGITFQSTVCIALACA